MSLLEVIDNTAQRIKDRELEKRMREKERALIEASGIMTTIESAEEAKANAEAIRQLVRGREQQEKDAIENLMQRAVATLLSKAFKEESERRY